jgi:choline dehydrogenase-like flavoprotein
MRQPSLRPFLMAERMPGPDKATDDELAAHAVRTCKTDHHPTGACKMGTDATAVVAPDLEVHGPEGLRVSDSSVMPRVPSSDTSAPTIMVEEKAAGRRAAPRA